MNRHARGMICGPRFTEQLAGHFAHSRQAKDISIRILNKFQISNRKYQTNHNYQNSKSQTVVIVRILISS